MNFDLHWISDRLVEVKVDDTKTGVLDAEEAKELAKEFIGLAAELLEVKE